MEEFEDSSSYTHLMKIIYGFMGILILVLTAPNIQADAVEVRTGYLTTGDINQVTAELGFFLKTSTYKDWHFAGIGGDLTRVTFFTDVDILKSYGPNWSGLIGLISLLGFKLGIGESISFDKDQRPQWLKNLQSYIGATSFYLGFIQMPLPPRVELGIPYLHLAAGIDSDVYLWSQKALVFRPWIGIVIQAESGRGDFRKYGNPSYLPFLEIRAVHNWCLGEGILPGRLHNKTGFLVQAGLTLQ